MKKGYKIFLISFILSLPFCWGINIFARNLEDFLFYKEMSKQPEIFTAVVSQPILRKEIERLRIERLQDSLKDLKIVSKSAISVLINNQKEEGVVFEKNTDLELPIASLTKLMTALVVFEVNEIYNLSQLITITKEAVDQDENYGQLKSGETLSIKELLYIMLIESSNDAAFALTEPASGPETGGPESFVNLMNFKAKNLGLGNTYFFNSTGLEPDKPEGHLNYSTAKDLVRLTKYILEKYPQIFEITRNQNYRVLKPDGSLHHFISENTNELLPEIPEIIGGKTGFTDMAGECFLLVLKAPKNSGYFINIILGSEYRFEEMREIIEVLENY